MKTSTCTKLIGFSLAAMFCVESRADPGSSLLGIRVGEPLEASSVPICRPRGPAPMYALDDRICLTPPMGTRLGAPHRMQNVPVLGFVYEVSVTTFGGRVANVMVDTKQIHFDTLLTMLREKFGEPGKTTTSEVVSQTGVRLPSRKITWLLGGGTSLTAIERISTIDSSSVFLVDSELMTKLDEAIATTNKATASKL